MKMKDWQIAEARIDASQIPDSLPLLDRLPRDFIEGLPLVDAAALRYDPRSYLRARQLPPTDPDWIVLVWMAGRGFGKSYAGAGWVISRILSGDRGDYALVAPTIDDCWGLQWRTLKALLPPWVRFLERQSRNEILLPDHGITLLMHSSEVTQYRGPNLRGAWCEEPVKWRQQPRELFINLRLAVRVAGIDPPRIVMTTTPPRELDWILEVCAEPTTRVIRGAMRDNPALDQRSVAAAYQSMAGTRELARELDGRVVIGVDGALFDADCLDRYRVDEHPQLEQIVVAVDPAQSAKRDADPVGIVVAGIASGHVYVLASCSERLDPADWAQRSIAWAEQHRAGRYVVEPTGSGQYPRATLTAQMQILGAARLPVVDAPTKGSKADRAQPLSAAAARGRIHLVGQHPALEKDLTMWHPGAKFSPGALDALVHAAAALTHGWRVM